ncbi:MAG: heavy-metal-associated domain-containing protein [Bacteroidia bacterium]|nr:heavy-metal-associated domain-containing protein [Bacteroidia bacterium]
MKTTTRIFLVYCLLAISGATLRAQDALPKIVETSFKVSGVCGECKERIETTLDTKGVKFASWNQDTQMLTLAFQPKKITEEKIHNLLTEAGHATEKAEANPVAYQNLPGCCQYESVAPH